MGIDASIFIRLKPEGELSLRCECWATVPDADCMPDGATHKITNLHRYFDKGYPRGHWPSLSALFLELLSNPDVETVWYSGDNVDTTDAHLLTFERYVGLCKVWLSEERY